MKNFKRVMALLLTVCMVMSFVRFGEPVASNAENYDPYVYVFSPDDSVIPAYYRDYAKYYAGWSPHEVAPDYEIVMLFNLVKVDDVIQNQADAPDGPYATVHTFCADLFVNVARGARYRRINLEDAHFCTANDKSKAEHIRAVVENSMPYLSNPKAVQDAANAYLSKVGGSEVVNLTGSELASAVQSAIWSFSDTEEFAFYNYYLEADNPYFGTVDFEDYGTTYTGQFYRITSLEDPLNVWEDSNYTANDIYGVYRYLRALTPVPAKDVLIAENSLYMEDAVLVGSGNNCTLNLIVGVTGTIDDNDDLTLTAKCGDQSKEYHLGATTTAEKVGEGRYAISFTGVSEAQCASVELELQGDQTASGAFFFEAEPKDGKTAKAASQGMVSYVTDSTPVQSKRTVRPLEKVVATQITKLDERSGEPLSGVSFDLYKEQSGGDIKIGTFTTDENGQIIVKVTDANAVYYFVETQALTGYQPVSYPVSGGSVTNDWNSGSLEVSKKLINTTPAAVGETFQFEVKLDLSTAPVAGNSFSWMTDTYFMEQLGSTKTLNWSVSGDRELTATFTLNADETITIDGIPQGTTYTLKELQTDEDRKWFDVTTQIGEGSKQESDTAQGTIAEENAVIFTNTVASSDVALGKLEVSKKLVNTAPAQVGETFNFKITLDLSTADVYEHTVPWIDDAYLLEQIDSSKNLTWTTVNGKYTAEFTVDADETVTIDGIARGTTYTVEEVQTEEDRQWFTVTTKVGEEAAKEGNTATGTIAEENAVLFTNTVSSSDVKLGKLEVSKKLVNTTPAQVGETFNFQITLDLSSADVYEDTVPWINDAYLLEQISSSENLTWTTVNGKYAAEFTVDADETVTIDGIAQGTTYTVKEVLTEEDRQWFTVTTKVGEEAAKEGNTATSTIAEENAVLFTNSVVTADVELGELAVSKKLINTTPAQVGETFHFEITLDLSTADVYASTVPWMNDAYLMDFVTCSKDLTWTEEDGNYIAKFTVDAGETVTIGGIARGTTYTVKEVQTDEDRQWFTVTTQIDEADAKTGNTTKSTVAEKNAVLFTNTVTTSDVKVGELEVSKKLINTTPAKVDETFDFEITLDLSTADAYKDGAVWMNDQYLLSLIGSSEDLSWTQKDGKHTAQFTVDAGETVTFSGIAQGTTYTVKEIQTEEDRQWFTVTTQIGENGPEDTNIAQSTIASENAVLFTNSVVTADVKVGQLDVSKKLINTTPAQVDETFNFEITLDLSTADAYENAVPWIDDAYLLSLINSSEALTWTEKDGKHTAAFTVDADETVTIKGIAQGTTYTVKEVQTAEERKWFTVTTKVGEEDAKDGNTAAGTIAKENAVLFTNSVVTADVKLGQLDVSKKLINTTPAQVDETFNFEITLDLSTADVREKQVPWIDDAYLLSLINSSEALTWTEKDGKHTAAFTVDADETVTIKGIAQGTTYTVEEVQTEEDRNWFVVTTQIGEEAAKTGNTAGSTIAEENAVLFTNSVVTADVKLGKLAVSKKLINTTPAEVGETFQFEITLDLSTADVHEKKVPWIDDAYLLSLVKSTEKLTWTTKDGKHTAQFTVDADETVTIEGIAQGSTYTVKEVQTEEDRKWFTVTTKIGEEAPKEGNIAESTIAEENAVLFTNSVVTADVKVGELAVSKKLINTTPAQVDETFRFKITLDLSTAKAYENAVPWMNDAYLMTLIHSSEKLTWTEEKGKHTAEFTVDADETVTIHGIAQGATYTVEEVQTEEDRNWFAVTTQIGEEEAKYSNVAESTVAEKNAVLFTNTVVTADVKLGKLEVSKKLINTTPAEVGETFNFQITLDLSTADAYENAVPWMNDTYLMSLIVSSETLNWTEENGKRIAEFTVDADETVTIDGIPQGATYTVEELQTEQDRQWFTVTTQIGEEEAKDGTTAAGTIAEENAVLFTNSVVTTDVEEGKLEVSKKLINTTPAEVGETFRFAITLDLSTADVYEEKVPWMNDRYLLSLIGGSEELTWTAEDGKYTAEFTVDADETVTIDGIAQGTTYTVEEIRTEQDRKWFTVTTQIGEEEAKEGSIAESTIAEENAVLFTNSVVTADVLTGKLEVSKKLINTTPAEVGETFHFRIALDLSTADVYEHEVPWMNDAYLMDFVSGSEDLTWTCDNGKYTAEFTVDADETVTIDGIAQGATYTVEEVQTEEDRKWFTVTTQIGEEDAAEGNTVISTVAEENAVLFTNSVVTADVEVGKLEVSKKLINTTPAEVGETFRFAITLDLSTADVYECEVPWMNDEYLMDFVTCSEDLTWTYENGKYTAEFTVDADETVAIDGVPQGTTYTVEEVQTEEDRNWFVVSTRIGEEDAQYSNTAESTVAERNAVLFTNTVVTSDVKLGKLEVSKKLLNTTPAEVGETFRFRITIDLSTADVYENPVPWMNDDYLLSLIIGTEELTWTENNGKYTAEFTVDADETVTIDGVAQGTTYTVEELQTEEDRKLFTVTTQVGEEAAKEGTSIESTIAEENAVLFTNSVVTADVKVGKLEVTKKVLNAAPAASGEIFNFRITLDLSTAEAYENAVPWMNDQYLLSLITGSKDLTWTKTKDHTYTAVFALKADETVTINNVALGSGYTLNEELTDSQRRSYLVSSRITTDGTAAAETKSLTTAGSIAAENAVLFTNERVKEDIPRTNDAGMSLSLLVCPLAVVFVAVLLMKRRRLI